MGFIKNILLGLALAVDATCVSVANSFKYNLKKIDLFIVALLFSFMQGFLPVIGYFIGYRFEIIIQNYSPIIAFVVLSYFGGKMILDYFKSNNIEEELFKEKISYKELFIQGIVTSLDALLIGVSFIGLGYNIWIISLIIAITTFIVVYLVSNLGNSYKKIFNKNAKLVGGIVLILIGLKILLN